MCENTGNNRLWGSEVRKRDLLKVLEGYDDDQLILVEASDGGFDEPVIYVSAVRARRSAELVVPTSAEYVFDPEHIEYGALILGTSNRLMTWG